MILATLHLVEPMLNAQPKMKELELKLSALVSEITLEMLTKVVNLNVRSTMSVLSTNIVSSTNVLILALELVVFMLHAP